MCVCVCVRVIFAVVVWVQQYSESDQIINKTRASKNYPTIACSDIEQSIIHVLCMHVYMHVYVCVRMCVCMYVCMNVCMYICTYIYKYVCISNKFVFHFLIETLLIHISFSSYIQSAAIRMLSENKRGRKIN